MKHLILSHGTTRDFEDFDPRATMDGGIHAGSLAQAQTRAGKKGRIVKIEVSLEKIRRSRDRGGGWRNRVAAARRGGFDAIVYLNRYEGLSTQTVVSAADSHVPLDDLDDQAFRQRCPEAEDSYILLNPDCFRILDRGA